VNEIAQVGRPRFDTARLIYFKMTVPLRHRVYTATYVCWHLYEVLIFAKTDTSCIFFFSYMHKRN